MATSKKKTVKRKKAVPQFASPPIFKPFSSGDVSTLGILNVTAADAVTLWVYHADNCLVVTVNDVVVYTRATVRDPRFNDRVEIAEFLNPGVNYINILGFDWGGAQHFAFKLDKNNNGVPGMSRDDKAGGAYGLARSYSLQINRT